MDAEMLEQRFGRLSLLGQRPARQQRPDRNRDPCERRPEERAPPDAEAASARNESDASLPAERRIVLDERNVVARLEWGR